MYDKLLRIYSILRNYSEGSGGGATCPTIQIILPLSQFSNKMTHTPIFCAIVMARALLPNQVEEHQLDAAGLQTRHSYQTIDEI